MAPCLPSHTDWIDYLRPAGTYLIFPRPQNPLSCFLAAFQDNIGISSVEVDRARLNGRSEHAMLRLE